MGKANFTENKYSKNLVIQAQKGNVNAFHELYNFNHKKIFTILLRLLGDEEIASRYTKELFVQSYYNFSSMPKQISYFGWLFGLAVHYSLVKIRKITKEGTVKTPGEIVIPKKLSRLDKKIISLIIEQRTAFVLRYVLDYSLDETADLLGSSKPVIFNSLVEASRNLLDLEIECEVDLKTIVEYNDKILQPEKKSEFENHLLLCSYCKRNFDSYKKLVDSASKLDAEVDIEKEFWDEINSKLHQKEKTVTEEHPTVDKYFREEHNIKNATREIIIPAASKRKFVKPLVSLFNYSLFRIGLFVLAVILLVFGYNNYSGIFENAEPWNSEVLTGEIFLNGKPVTSNFSFQPGDEISTGANSQVKIKTSPKRIIIGNNFTRISRSSIEKNLGLEIKKGKLSIFSEDDANVFKIILSGADIYDLGSESTINVINESNFIVTCNLGYIEMENGDEYSLLNERSECSSTNEHVGIPYRIDAPDAVRKMIKLFWNNLNNKAYIQNLLNILKFEDGITLWNLLRRVNDDNRRFVFKRMVEYFPLPKNISKDAILALDELALRNWLDLIEGR